MKKSCGFWELRKRKQINDLYTELSEIMGTLEAYEMELGMMISDGENKKANHYLEQASQKIRQALSEKAEIERKMKQRKCEKPPKSQAPGRTQL